MAFKLSKRSKGRLEGVHTDLVKVVERAIQLTNVDFTVLEGVRTLERQRRLVASGASKTLNSRHLTGHAVDLGAYVDGEVRWDWPLYFVIADAMKRASLELDVTIEWGGTWTDNTHEWDRENMSRSFPDGPHFQLPWATYPKG